MKAQDLIKKLQKIGSKTDADIEKVESVDGAVVVTFKKEEVFENKLPKSWEEFCEMFPIKDGECYINSVCEVESLIFGKNRHKEKDKNLLPDRATAETVLALCQLIQLRNAYNVDWVPDFTNPTQDKFTIGFCGNKIDCDAVAISNAIFYFKTAELRDEFLRNFRPLIDKLKPLYGIKSDNQQ